MPDLLRVIGANEARVNVTHRGRTGDLPDPVARDSTDADVKAWVTEAVRGGGIPGIPADATADFRDYVVERVEDDRSNVLLLRPKTPFGA
jgi:hypothetical protein